MQPPKSLYRSPAQAAALADVIEREARWRNLLADRATGPQAKNTSAPAVKQAAYEDFQEKLVIYNRLHRPTYREFWPVTSPASLARWSRTMADIVCGAGLTECPAALLENAFRRAEKLARRLGVDDVAGPTAPLGVANAVAALVEIARWSEGLVEAPEGGRVAA